MAPLAPPVTGRRPEDDEDPVMGTVGAGGGIVQLPALSTKTEGPQTTTTRTEMAPVRREDIEAQRTAGAAEVEAKRQEGAAVVQQKNQDVLDAIDQEKETQRLLDERARVQKEHNDEIAARKADLVARRGAMDEASKNRTASYFSDKGAAAEIFSHFIVGLSERSHRLAGGEAGDSPMQRDLNRKLAEDAKAKQAKFEDSKTFAELAQNDVHAAEAAKLAHMAEVKEDHIAIVDNLIKRAKKYAAAIGTAEAQAKADGEVSAMEATKAKILADQEKDLDKQIRTEGRKVTVTKNDAGTTKSGSTKITASDIDKRQGLYEQEEASKELAELAKEDPDGFKYFQANEKRWTPTELLESDGIGRTVSGAIKSVTGPMGADVSKDDAMRNAPPGAKRAFQLWQKMLSGMAKERGGPITASDDMKVKEERGLLRNSPGDFYKSSLESADSARRRRESLEANKHFADPIGGSRPYVRMKDRPGTGTMPDGAEPLDTSAGDEENPLSTEPVPFVPAPEKGPKTSAEARQAIQARKDAARDHLILLRGRRGGALSPSASQLDQARLEAKAAGLSDAIIEGIMK